MRFLVVVLEESMVLCSSPCSSPEEFINSLEEEWKSSVEPEEEPEETGGLSLSAADVGARGMAVVGAGGLGF